MFLICHILIFRTIIQTLSNFIHDVFNINVPFSHYRHLFSGDLSIISFEENVAYETTFYYHIKNDKKFYEDTYKDIYIGTHNT